MPIDSHLPQADPFSLVPTFKASPDYRTVKWGASVSLLKLLVFVTPESIVLVDIFKNLQACTCNLETLKGADFCLVLFLSGEEHVLFQCLKCPFSKTKKYAYKIHVNLFPEIIKIRKLTNASNY